MMHDSLPVRIVIYAKDITNITGKKERTARKMIAAIRRHYNKRAGDLITMYEFCEYTGIREEKVRQFLAI